MWYVLLWNLLALGWWLFSVFVYHILNPLNSFVFWGFFVLFCETFIFIICTKILYCLLALLKKKTQKTCFKSTLNPLNGIKFDIAKLHVYAHITSITREIASTYACTHSLISKFILLLNAFLFEMSQPCLPLQKL